MKLAKIAMVLPPCIRLIVRGGSVCRTVSMISKEIGLKQVLSTN